MARSLKRKVSKEEFRCRKCGLFKKVDEYYKSCEPDLDLNGRMSICKDCCKEILETFMSSEGGIIEKVFLRLCKKLNILYDETSILKTREKMEELRQAGKPLDSLLGVYLRNLFANNPENAELIFQEPTTSITIVEDSLDNINFKMSNWEKEWGQGLSFDDYTFLDEELARWEETHKSDTMAEKTLLKEITYLQLNIRKERIANHPTDELVKNLQSLMKTAAIDPLKASKDKGESIDTISSIIKIMESQYPAEFYKDRDLYKDFDNISEYYDKHVTRPLKNFVTNSRDFNFSLENEAEDIEDDNEDVSLEVFSKPEDVGEVDDK